MPKFIPDSELKEMQRDPRTQIYFVRKRLKGKPPLLKSTKTRDRTKARKVAMKILAEYYGTEKSLSAVPTYREIADKVFALKGPRAQATRDLAHNRLYKHLCPYFGHMPINKVTENTWEAYISEQQMASSRTLADDAKLMMAVMKFAFNERLIEKKVRIRNPDPPNEEGRAYSEEDVAKLLAAASTENMRLQIRIGVTMGMRHGEIASLMFQWINWEEGKLKLPPEVTKTRRGRVVPINAEVRKELLHRHMLGYGPYVFPSPKHRGKPIPDFDSQWQRTWERAGMDGVFHWTRHTCISNMLAAGIPESTVKKITGCSQRTIAKVYMHLKDDLAAKAVNI